MKLLNLIPQISKKIVSSVVATTMIAGLCITAALIPGSAAPAAVLESTGMASFTSDTATKGDWNGKYGKDGLVLPGYLKTPEGREDLVKLPGYIQSIDFKCATAINNGRTMWREADELPEGLALGRENTGLRRVAYIFDGKSITVKIIANDENIHRVSFYAAKVSQTLNYQMFKLGTTEAVSDKISIKVTNGTYVTAEFKGSVDVVINGEKNAKSVILGMFFDTDNNLPIQKISVRPEDGSEIRPYAGKFQMVMDTIPSKPQNGEVKWIVSGDTDIAHVDTNGMVTMSGFGKASIKAVSKANNQITGETSIICLDLAKPISNTQIFDKNGIYAIQNDKVCIVSKGSTYSIFDSQTAIPYVLNAYFEINKIKSTQGSPEILNLKSETLRIKNAMGAGKISTVLDITLEDGKGEILFTPGIINDSEKEVKLMEAYPMVAEASDNSGIYVGPNPAKNHSILTGEANWGTPNISFNVSTLSSKNNLMISYRDNPNKESFMLGGLTTYEFQNEVITCYKGPASCESNGRDSIDAKIHTFDYAGKLVDIGKTYFADKSLINFSEKNPYASLENFAKKQAKAMKVDLGKMDDTIYQSLYYVENYGGSPKANNANFAVEEANRVKKSGLNNYAKFNIGLEPDTYTNPNEQLWWDDAHWKEFGHLTTQYPSLVSMGNAVRSAGQEFGLYMQSGYRSKDYVNENPAHMIDNNKTNTECPDYTDPDFLNHMKNVYKNIKNANGSMMMFDYTNQYRDAENKPIDNKEMLKISGGFEDKYATAVSAYRNIYRLPKENVGSTFKNVENAWTYGGEEVATGLIDFQRTGYDTTLFNPSIAKIGTYQWYRHRTTKLVYPDVNIFENTDKDLRRAQITGVGLMFGKLSLGESISKISPEKLWDITRVAPMPIDGAAPRPVGLFENQISIPSVYDYKFANNDTDHLLLMWNKQGEDSDVNITAKLGEDSAFGGIDLDKNKSYDVWDFWNWKYIGRFKGNDDLTLSVRSNEMKTLAVREVTSAPIILSTNRHILQGTVDTKNVSFDRSFSKMTGTFDVAANDTYKAIISFGDRDLKLSDVNIKTKGVKSSYKVDKANNLIEITIDSTENKLVDFEINFKPIAATTTTTTTTSVPITATSTSPITITTTKTQPIVQATTTAPISITTDVSSSYIKTTLPSSETQPKANNQPSEDNPNTGTSSGIALGIIFSASALTVLGIRKQNKFKGNK